MNWPLATMAGLLVSYSCISAVFSVVQVIQRLNIYSLKTFTKEGFKKLRNDKAVLLLFQHFITHVCSKSWSTEVIMHRQILNVTPPFTPLHRRQHRALIYDHRKAIVSKYGKKKPCPAPKQNSDNTSIKAANKLCRNIKS